MANMLQINTINTFRKIKSSQGYLQINRMRSQLIGGLKIVTSTAHPTLISQDIAANV